MRAVSRHFNKSARSCTEGIFYVVLAGENPSMSPYLFKDNAITDAITKAVFILEPVWIPSGLSERRMFRGFH